MNTSTIKMNLAIFWLPIIGGGILWAIAISAWYGSDKLPSVWFAFAGTVCLLLTLFIQAHQYVVETSLQPRLTLLSPPGPSHFRWDPTQALIPVFKGPNEKLMEGHSATPKFQLVNSGVPGSDAEIKWEAPGVDPQQLLAASALFRRYVGSDVNDERYRLLLPQGGTITTPSARQFTLPLPFLTRPTEVFIPSNVWARGLLVAMGQLPDTPGPLTFSIRYRATVSWNIPDHGKPASFAIIAKFTNTKQLGDSAIHDADVEFDIERIADEKAL